MNSSQLIRKSYSITTFKRFPNGILRYSTKKNNNNINEGISLLDLDHMPFDKPEQSFSGTTPQFVHSKIAFDTDCVKPENQIEEMKNLDNKVPSCHLHSSMLLPPSFAFFFYRFIYVSMLHHVL